jgi:hypothetical protein
MREPTRDEFIALSILAVLIPLFVWRFHLSWGTLSGRLAVKCFAK